MFTSGHVKRWGARLWPFPPVPVRMSTKMVVSWCGEDPRQEAMGMSVQRMALGLAGLALGGMAAVTVWSDVLSNPGVIEERRTSSPGTATATTDRAPHSYSAVVPTSVCAKPELACQPAHTH